MFCSFSKFREIRLRFQSFALAFAISASAAGITACGSDGVTAKGGGASGNGSNSVTLVTPGTETHIVRIRWFPNDRDQSYKINFRSIETKSSPASPESIDGFSIEPVGCTSAAISGYTSGVCVYDLETSNPLSIEISIEAQTDRAAKLQSAASPLFRVGTRQAQ